MVSAVESNGFDHYRFFAVFHRILRFDKHDSLIDPAQLQVGVVLLRLSFESVPDGVGVDTVFVCFAVQPHLHRDFFASVSILPERALAMGALDEAGHGVRV